MDKSSLEALKDLHPAVAITLIIAVAAVLGLLIWQWMKTIRDI